MPTQKFAPMTKNFATFDCDAHVTEPPWLWERAKDWLTSAELEALKDTMWFDDESKQLIVNGFAVAGHGRAGYRPGDDHPDRYRYVSVDPERGRREGDVQGLQRLGLRLLSGRSRAVVFCGDAADAEPQVRRAGAIPRRGEGLPRWSDPPDRCDGQLPDSAQILTPVEGDGRDRDGLRDASVPGVWIAQTARLYGATLGCGVDSANSHVVGVAAFFSDECAELSGGSVAMGRNGIDDGLLRALPEDEGGGLRGLIDVAELPRRRVRQGVQALSQRAQTEAADAPAERDVLRALRDRLRGR